MSVCKRCKTDETPPTVQGIKLDLPRDWAVVSVLAHPSRTFILCNDCVKGLNDRFMRDFQHA